MGIEPGRRNQYPTNSATTNRAMINSAQTKIHVGCELSYHVRQTTTFLLKIAAASTAHQGIVSEELNVTPGLPPEHCQVGVEGNRLQRLVVEPCQLEIRYHATVNLEPEINQPGDLRELDAGQMPPDVLTYLNPSRYCESDVLGRFAFEEFGELPRGYSRVRAICDWVFEHLDYTLGSTGSTTTAADVLLQREGVCRDYAHLMITLCRGAGIPARYVSGYAVNLQPPDFHGFVEAFLDGHWYLFDPTRLASTDALVHIGIGRDAADVAFATLTGSSVLQSKFVWANFDDASPSGEPHAAISTA
ncbi:MAG: transglutaminase family protein [Thiohalocapsa sp.]